LFTTYVFHAALYGHLDDPASAAQAVRDLLALRPDYAEAGRAELDKWYLPEFVDHVAEGLRKAGLALGKGGPDVTPVSTSKDRATPAVAIAVLPFSDLSAGRDQEYLCEGMAEEIMTALMRIEGLQIASRTS